MSVKRVRRNQLVVAKASWLLATTSSLLMIGGCGSISSTASDDPVSKCRRFIDETTVDDVVSQMATAPEISGIDEETIRSLAADLVNDPETKSLEFQSCLMDLGYRCLPSSGEQDLDNRLVEMARNSGWKNPELNTCLSPDDVKVPNPYSK